jgi:putative DNA primase/helicase
MNEVVQERAEEAVRERGATGSTEARTDRQSSPASQPADAAARTRAATSVQRRYLVDGDRYLSRQAGNPVAFEDRGGRLRTSTDDPEVARSMMRLAFGQGWSQATLSGSAAFRREAWLEASALGLETRGYAPQPADRARLREILEETLRQTPSEPETRRTKPKAARRIGVDAEDRASREDARLVEVLKAQMRARGDGESAIARAATLATQALRKERSVGGTVVEFGRAPYAFDPANNVSFYVKLDTGRGERTVWGLELERSLREARIGRGDLAVLTNSGPEGESTRNRWSALALTRLAEQEQSDALRKANRSPQIRVFDPQAPRPTQTPPQRSPQRPRDTQRERG